MSLLLMSQLVLWSAPLLYLKSVLCRPEDDRLQSKHVAVM